MVFLHQPPLVVGTIRPEGLAALGAVPRIKRLPDITEARLDLAVDVSHPTVMPDLRPFLVACQRLQDTGSPVLCTIRLVPDGGRWTEDAGRMAWFDEALAVAAWVDIEVESAIAAEVATRAHALGDARSSFRTTTSSARPPWSNCARSRIDRARSVPTS